MTIKELAATISQGVDLYIGKESNAIEYTRDNVLTAAAFGDFVIDTIYIVELDKIAVTVKLTPAKN